MNPAPHPDLPRHQGPHGASARFRVGVAAGIGLAVGIVLAPLTSWSLAPLIAWDVAAAVYVGWMWPTIWSLDAEETARQAVREDPTRTASDTILIGSALVSLLAVGFAIAQANGHDLMAIVQVALGVLSVVLSWAVVHTVYTLRYARLYYTGRDGGIDFNAEEPPRYVDFAYVAFTIGMTFQVSDTNFKNTTFRATALRHALLSYLFGTVIVATTINLIAGLRH